MGEICLLDTGCLSLAVAVICALVAACKRIIAHEDICGPRPPPNRIVRVTAASATVNGIGGASGCLLIMEIGGYGAKTAAPLAILTILVLDLSTAAGRAWLYAVARSIRSTHPEPPSPPPSPPPSTQDVPVTPQRRQQYRQDSHQDGPTDPPEAPL